ncbi:hypothetical protein K3495_g11083 [Podosphaera aphanis]|nr:hypothetical protein K3495_g11083 [Podosphaera aphanis]
MMEKYPSKMSVISLPRIVFFVHICQGESMGIETYE